LFLISLLVAQPRGVVQEQAGRRRGLPRLTDGLGDTGKNPPTPQRSRIVLRGRDISTPTLHGNALGCIMSGRQFVPVVKAIRITLDNFNRATTYRIEHFLPPPPAASHGKKPPLPRHSFAFQNEQKRGRRRTLEPRLFRLDLRHEMHSSNTITPSGPRRLYSQKFPKTALLTTPLARVVSEL
jgi:hypothetical protein